MSRKKKTQISAKQGAALYYMTRSLQRVSLVCLGLAVSAVYASMVHAVLTSSAYETFKSVDLNGVQVTNLQFSGEISVLVGVLAVVSIALSLLMLAFPRVRKFQKQLVVDGVVIATTLLLLTIMIIPIINWSLARFF